MLYFLWLLEYIIKKITCTPKVIDIQFNEDEIMPFIVLYATGIYQ